VKQKNLALLSIAILSMAILIWSQGQTGSTDQKQLLLASLKENLNLLEKVEIKSSAESVSLVRLEDGWGVSERHLYPADFAKLSKLLDALGRARLVEKKTSKPDNFAILEVRDVDIEGSKANLVSGIAPDYGFSVLIGKSAGSRDGQFVRRQDEEQVWLTDESFEPGGSVISWLDPVIINIDSERVVRVEQFDASGDIRLSAERVEGEDNVVLRNLPEDRRLRYPSVANELMRSLVNVRLTDVVPHQPENWQASSRSEYSLADGGKVTVNAVELNDKKWLHVTTKSLSEEKKIEQLGKWDFEVTDYVFDDFVKQLDDLLEPLAAPNKEPSAAPDKEPLAAPNKEPSAAPNKEPSAAPNKDPLKAPQESP
jgi:Domain of unknown function (DUF4340)